jgi:Tfp pilus assembly protein PilN
MIKINLLGVTGAAPAAAARPPVSRAFQVWTFLGALIVCFLVVGLFYKVWSGAVASLQKDLEKEKAEQARLAAIKAENARYQLRLSQLEQRINTIQALQASRVGPVDLMNALGNLVNRTNDLYLLTAGFSGDRMSLRGQSRSVESVAEFISQLDNSGFFSDVQLRQFFEDDQQNRLAYKFTLDCAFKSPASAAAAVQPATPGAPAAPARRAGM